MRTRIPARRPARPGANGSTTSRMWYALLAVLGAALPHLAWASESEESYDNSVAASLAADVSLYLSIVITSPSREVV
jgi:hypothetical protein